jgi:predicted amidohydrolase YtcJ
MRKLALAAALALACGGASGPDLVVHGGVVLTMDAEQPVAEAFLIRDGRIAAVGGDADVLALADEGVERFALAGKTVLPGFNDAHLHPLLLPPGSASLARATDVEQVVEALRAQARAAPDAPWILGYAYDDTALGRHLDRRDLDRVATQRPVLAWHASLHLMAVNSVALDTAGIDRDTPDPDDGFFYRDEEGRPTGLLGERAALAALVTERQPTPLVDDLTSARAGLEAFYRQALRLGITSFTDALVPPELVLAYLLTPPQAAGIRANLMFDGESLRAAIRIMQLHDLLAFTGWRPLDGPWLRARGVKIFHGLSLSGRTARLHEPYADRPGYFGLDPQRSQAELDALVAEIHDAGFQAAIHANGDYEIDMVLDAIEKAAGAADAGRRHRIEHGSIVNERILARMRALGVVLAPHSYVYEKGPMLDAYGEKRWDWMFPNASTFEYAIPNAGNSDFPVSGLDPMLRIQSLVTRTSRQGRSYGARQRLSVEQALRVYTLGGAYASFEENLKGSITPGKFADFLVMSDDPRRVPPASLAEVRVERTFVGGIERFRRSAR